MSMISSKLALVAAMLVASPVSKVATSDFKCVIAAIVCVI